MRKKMIGIWDVIVIGAVNATLVGVLGLTMGADIHHPIFSDMWWCFFGSVNVYLVAEPTLIRRIWR